MHETDNENQEEIKVKEYRKPVPKNEKTVKTALDKWLDAEKEKVERLKDSRKLDGGKSTEEDDGVKKIPPPKEEETIDVLKKQAGLDKAQPDEKYFDSTKNAIKQFDKDKFAKDTTKKLAQASSGASADDYDGQDVELVQIPTYSEVLRSSNYFLTFPDE